MNFALLLFILSILSGLIIMIDKVILQKRLPLKTYQQSLITKKIIEAAYSCGPVLVFVFLLRAFIIEPFRIPSGSLEPTLNIGDFVVINKFSYGIRLPIIEKKIINYKHPQRGDIAVFRWPPNPKFDFIKRVIGVPGDHISYYNKTLIINKKIMPRKFIRYTIDESTDAAVAEYQENLNGVRHSTYIRTSVPAYNFEIDVPEGYYFMMGDNRDDSADSRYWGLVEDSYLRGKALLVWMSWDRHTHWFRWSNIGHLLN